MKKHLGTPTVITVLFFILIAASCSDGSSGESGNRTETRSRDTVYETETVTAPAGNKVADTLRLYEDGTFELIKTASYEDVRAAAVFYTGSYSGDVLSGLDFTVQKQLDESLFTEELKSAFALSIPDARNSAARAARSADEIKALLEKCKALLAKLELIAAVNAPHLDYSLKNLKQAQQISLDGFVLTGDFCPVIEDEWRWAASESEGAVSLRSAGNGIYQCDFIASCLVNGLYIKCRVMQDNWKQCIGYSDIDIKTADLPNGVQIVMDSARLSQQWADIENIVLLGVNNLSTYRVQFDTASAPGTVRISMKEIKKNPAIKDIVGQNFENLYGKVSIGENDRWSYFKIENNTPLIIKSYKNTGYGGYNTGVNFSSRNPFTDWPVNKYFICDSIDNFGWITDDGITYWLYSKDAAKEEQYTLTFSWTDDSHIRMDIVKN